MIVGFYVFSIYIRDFSFYCRTLSFSWSYVLHWMYFVHYFLYCSFKSSIKIVSLSFLSFSFIFIVSLISIFLASCPILFYFDIKAPYLNALSLNDILLLLFLSANSSRVTFFHFHIAYLAILQCVQELFYLAHEVIGWFGELLFCLLLLLNLLFFGLFCSLLFFLLSSFSSFLFFVFLLFFLKLFFCQPRSVYYLKLFLSQLVSIFLFHLK